MLGRDEEATTLIQQQKWTREVQLIINFFWAINLLRRSQYKLAKKLIVESYFLIKKVKKNQFYFYQAIAFFRYFTGSFELSLGHALKAMFFCEKEHLSYEKIYSMDIIGHIYNQTGEFYKSIDFLEKAQSFSKSLDCIGTSKAIETSIIGYKLEGGHELETNIVLAKKIIKSSKPQEFYLLSQIQLQLIKAYYLSGKVSEMKKILKEVSFNIYKTKNHRQSILLNVTLANLYYTQSNYQQALFSLSSAKKFLNKNIDNVLELKILGLENRILTELGQNNPETMVRQHQLEIRTSYYLNRVIRERENKNIVKESIYFSDPVYQILRGLNFKKMPQFETIRLFDSNHLLGLLNFFDPLKNKTALIFGVKKNRILIIHNSDVSWSNSQISKFQYQVLKFVFEKKMLSKRDLIERIWNYQYEGYTHDPLIYNTFSRIKKRDPLLASFINFFGDIEIRGNIDIYGLTQREFEKINKKKIKNFSRKVKNLNLNFRQLRLLEFLEPGASISPNEYQKLFEVSRMTATRDLRELSSDRYLLRTGKSRSTKYIRT